MCVFSAFADGRHPTSRPDAGFAGAQPRRARGNLPRAQHPLLAAWDRPVAGSITIDDQSRGAAQWRARTISSDRLRSGGLGPSLASETLQAGLPTRLGPDSIRQAAAELVARADRRLAQAYLARGAAQSGVTRNHLPQPVHPDPRGAEERAAGPPQGAANDPTVAACTLKRNGLGQIKDAVSISERPASVEDRAIPGHWEGDLIGGSRNSYVATLVERHSRYVMLVKVANKDTESVVSALIKQSKKLPRELYQSLTWDRGKELADHKRLAMATDVEVYFCDPRSPWQRGSNENTNRLLRQYLPHGTDLSLHSQAQLSAIARQLNERPRKTLLYRTPAETFAACVAAIS